MRRCREEGPRKERGDYKRQVPPDTAFTCMGAWAHSDQYRDRYSWERMMVASVNCGHFGPCGVIDRGMDGRIDRGIDRVIDRAALSLTVSNRAGCCRCCGASCCCREESSMSLVKVLHHIERSWWIKALFLRTWLGSFLCTPRCSYIHLLSPSINGTAPLNLASIEVRLKVCLVDRPSLWFPIQRVDCSATVHLKMHVIPKIRSWIPHWSQEQQDAVGIDQRYSNEQEKSNIRSLKTKSIHNSHPHRTCFMFYSQGVKKQTKKHLTCVYSSPCNFMQYLWHYF